MENTPSMGLEMARQAPLTFVAGALSFLNQYGAVLVTCLALVYAMLQIVLRIIEHKAIIRKNKEKSDGSDRE